MSLGIRRFYQNVDDQLVTLFGVRVIGRPPIGSWTLLRRKRWARRSDGLGRNAQPFIRPRLRGSVDYSVIDAPLGAVTRCRACPCGRRRRCEPTARDFHDITTMIETEIPETATRVFVLYKFNTRIHPARSR